jgi:hypothetical protein
MLRATDAVLDAFRLTAAEGGVHLVSAKLKQGALLHVARSGECCAVA